MRQKFYERGRIFTTETQRKKRLMEEIPVKQVEQVGLTRCDPDL